MKEVRTKFQFLKNHRDFWDFVQLDKVLKSLVAVAKLTIAIESKLSDASLNNTSDAYALAKNMVGSVIDCGQTLTNDEMKGLLFAITGKALLGVDWYKNAAKFFAGKAFAAASIAYSIADYAAVGAALAKAPTSYSESGKQLNGKYPSTGGGTTTTPTSPIVGTWKLVKSNLQPVLPSQQGNADTFTFKSDNSFKQTYFEAQYPGFISIPVGVQTPVQMTDKMGCEDEIGSFQLSGNVVTFLGTQNGNPVSWTATFNIDGSFLNLKETNRYGSSGFNLDTIWQKVP